VDVTLTKFADNMSTFQDTVMAGNQAVTNRLAAQEVKMDVQERKMDQMSDIITKMWASMQAQQSAQSSTSWHQGSDTWSSGNWGYNWNDQQQNGHQDNQPDDDSGELPPLTPAEKDEWQRREKASADAAQAASATGGDDLRQEQKRARANADNMDLY
jgi:uncharacterized coiled-coil protein SlyX